MKRFLRGALGLLMFWLGTSAVMAMLHVNQMPQHLTMGQQFLASFIIALGIVAFLLVTFGLIGLGGLLMCRTLWK